MVAFLVLVLPRDGQSDERAQGGVTKLEITRRIVEGNMGTRRRAPSALLATAPARG